MRLVVLIALATLMPLVWGGAMYWLITRCWPAREGNGVEEPTHRSAPPYDYQI